MRRAYRRAWPDGQGRRHDSVGYAILRRDWQTGEPDAYWATGNGHCFAAGRVAYTLGLTGPALAVDTALKIALAYHNVSGNAGRVRLIGRERGYHGVGFGGISVGGMVANRKMFGTMLAGVDHLPHTYNREKQAFTKGEPEWGAHLADDLDRALQDFG